MTVLNRLCRHLPSHDDLESCCMAYASSVDAMTRIRTCHVSEGADLERAAILTWLESLDEAWIDDAGLNATAEITDAIRNGVHRTTSPRSDASKGGA